jgi:hypothetical protein
MYELKKIGKLFTSKFVGTGPSSYKKEITGMQSHKGWETLHYANHPTLNIFTFIYLIKLFNTSSLQLVSFLVQSQKIMKIHSLLILYHTRKLSNIIKQGKKSSLTEVEENKEVYIYWHRTEHYSTNFFPLDHTQSILHNSKQVLLKWLCPTSNFWKPALFPKIRRTKSRARILLQ